MKVVNKTNILVEKGLTQFTPLEGKRPLKAGWQKYTLTAEQIKEHIDRNKNYGVVIPQGFIVIDIDMPGHDELKKWDFNETLTIKTGTGKFHFYYKLPSEDIDYDIKNIKLIMDSKVVVAEIKTKGGQVVGPGSLHPDTGKHYLIEKDLPIATIDPEIWERIKTINEDKKTPAKKKKVSTSTAELTKESFLADIAAATKAPTDREINWAKKAFKNELKAVKAETREGFRNEQLLTSVRAIGGLVSAGLLDESEVRDAFFGASSIEEYKEKNDTINSAINWTRSRPRRMENEIAPDPFEDSISRAATKDLIQSVKNRNYLSLNDKGNGQRLNKIYGHNINYSECNKCYYVWSKKVWQPSPEGLKVQEYAKRLGGIIRKEANAYPDETKEDLDTKKAIQKWAHKSEFMATIGGAMKTAKSESDIQIDISQFDVDPDILNVENGILNLRTRVLMPYDPDKLCTKISPVKYDPDATYVDWQVFIDSILDKEIGKYLQRVLGYALLGRNYDQKFWIIDGIGNNGKSTLFDVIAKVLGDYAPVCPQGMWEQTKYQTNHDAGSATLMGSRVMFKSEITKGATLNTTQLKNVTGDEYISIRPPYGKEFIPILNTVTPFLIVNDLPFTDHDKALMRRLLRICFDRTIADKDVIIGLADSLFNNEKSGILNWLLEGLKDYLTNGLQIPEKCIADTLDYIKEEDIFGSFADQFLIFDKKLCIGVNELYERFCASNNEMPTLAKKQWFSRKFRVRFIKELDFLNPKGKQYRRRLNDKEPNATMIRGVGWNTAEATVF